MEAEESIMAINDDSKYIEDQIEAERKHYRLTISLVASTLATVIITLLAYLLILRSRNAKLRAENSCSKAMTEKQTLELMYMELSAEHDTPIPTGHEAPWLRLSAPRLPYRGIRITRTSWQKYFPPNCAPMPIFRVISRIVRSISRSRNARPSSFPLVCRLSRYFAEASFTVFRHVSADVPPITTAKWYGGHAAVPRLLIFASMNGIRRSTSHATHTTHLESAAPSSPGTGTTCSQSRRPSP